MNYLLAVVCPPFATWKAGAKKQLWLSLLLFLTALYLLRLASAGGVPGAYAAAPVIYVAAIIHAFIFTHRQAQQQTGDHHPHRGSASQSSGVKQKAE